MVLPVMLALAAGCAALIAAAVLESSWQLIVYIAIAAALASAATVVVAAKVYARDQANAMRQNFETAIPRDASGAMVFRAPDQSASVEETLADFAELFGRKLSEAAQDKGQLLTIIASMNEGLIAVDHQQRILLANRAAENLLGLSINSAQGKPLWEQVSVEGVAGAASEVMLTGRPKTLSAGPHNGKYMEIMVSRLPASSGLVIVAHDITEATRYQRLREEFVANVSHELRTPLAVIKGFVETLRDGALDDRERAVRYLDTVATYAEQLSNLVNDILDLSRLEGRGVSARRDRVDVGATLQKAAELLHPAAERKQQTLSIEIAEKLPAVLGSSEYLGRAFGNLIENAIKYTREGGAIKVSAATVDGRVLVAVEDNGIGISEEDLPRIFERFYRSDQSRSREMGGTGLGLSIVKHIVQAHAGAIEVTSRLGAGSKFTVRLPGVQ